MNVEKILHCDTRPCPDIVRERYVVPQLELDPDRVRIVMVSEAPPENPADWFYAGDDALFARTTVQAFKDAGADVETLGDVLDLGVYLTTAVKCGKTGYGVSTGAVDACSPLLEVELGLFPFARVLMLMGDVAIKAVNTIARRNGEPRVVPAGATCRLRGGDYRYHGLKVFPSYLQAGPAYLIERNKREMVAEDIAAALAYVRTPSAAA